MQPTATRGATNLMHAPENWEEKETGLTCAPIEVRIDLHGPQMVKEYVCTWKPDAEDLARLNAGAAIELGIMADGQPPCILRVVDPVCGYVGDLKEPITINEDAHGHG